MDLVIKEEWLSDEAKQGLKNLRMSELNVTDVINKFLESFSALISEKVA
jgi:hypothetical protein